jgi:aminoglycoside phosphotransferase family enzyme/predicted kinase
MTDIAPEQRAVVRFLEDPATHRGASVERVDTHISHVFLVGERALKLRRALRTNFLDFSTVARREAACRRELEVNAVAGDLYRGVTPVTRGAEGLALGGSGEAVDWVTEMARFDRESEFDRLAARGALDRGLIERLADAVAASHAGAQQHRARGGAEGALGRVDQIAAAVQGAAEGYLDREVAAWRRRARAEAEVHAPLLEARGRRGCVRRCHGDLHLGNVCLFEGRPTPFDAIEFNEEIATIDVLYDAAFMVMDLMERGLGALANAFLGRWLSATRDASGLALLPLYVSMRAAVRAIAAAGDADASPTAAERMAFATTALAPRPAPVLVAVGGPSGSGKSTLARALAPDVGAAPGAVALRSDVARKRLYGVDPEAHLPAEAYAPEIGARVYDRLLADARRALRAGAPVILDAAFLDLAEQEDAAALARRLGVRFHGFWLSADAGTMAARLAARRGDASDADAAVLDRQLRAHPDAPGWTHLDATRPPEAVAEAARAALQ